MNVDIVSERRANGSVYAARVEQDWATEMKRR